MAGKLRGMTVFSTGASRGIGKAIALRCAQDGANIVIASKTAEPHPKLPGTIYTAAQEVEKAGGQCLPCIVDVRFEDQVQKAVDDAVKRFGGIDILVNNASAIDLSRVDDASMKKYDLMQSVNVRGTFLCSKICIPHLRKGRNPHILNISQPLNMEPDRLKNSIAYTISKYGMSMCTLGMAEEFKEDGIAVNAIWPKSVVWTAAVSNNPFLLASEKAEEFRKHSRAPEIMADAAYAMITKDSRQYTGHFVKDEDLLREEGVTDFSQYTWDQLKHKL